MALFISISFDEQFGSTLSHFKGGLLNRSLTWVSNSYKDELEDPVILIGIGLLLTRHGAQIFSNSC